MISQSSTEDDHTIQDGSTGLFIPLHIRSTFFYFVSRKPTANDLSDRIPVVITPDGDEWKPYCKSYTENEDALINAKGELNPPAYIQSALVSDEDLPNINSVMGIMDECLNRNDNQAVIASFESQDVDFTVNDVESGLRMSEIASIATVPFNTQWEPAYENISVGQD